MERAQSNAGVLRSQSRVLATDDIPPYARSASLASAKTHTDEGGAESTALLTLRACRGTDDQMDYTIIGGAVNLASRLEHEAQPGTVPISYETFAQVKDAIHCEEQGRIQVRGIAYSVATFRVVDLRANLAARPQPVSAALPHLKLHAEPGLMSVKERDEATRTLRDLLERLQ